MTYLLDHRPLNEITELFPRQSMNQLVQGEIAKVIPQIEDPEIRSDLERLYQMDFSGYADRSLRAAGFRDPDLDGLVNDILVKLVVTPGGLVSRWRRDAPLSFRFKRAVKNAVTTLGERASRRRRQVREMPDDLIARERPRDEDDLISDFRRWLEDEHGAAHRIVLDARLAGEDIKNLAGTATGIPSSYALKRIVQQIKASAVRWAGTDPAFQAKVQKLMDAEQATLTKRFRRDRAGV